MLSVLAEANIYLQW